MGRNLLNWGRTARGESRPPPTQKKSYAPNNMTRYLNLLLTYVFRYRQGAPVALPHPVLSPVYIPVVLELAVPVPHPEQQDQQHLPHDPEQHDFLAVLLGAADQTEVRQQTDDRSDKGRTCIIYIIIEL